MRWQLESADEKIVGYVSLDGTFVGLSWISDELFGKPSGEVHPDRTLARKQRCHQLPKKANVPRPEKSNLKEPNDVPPRNATAPQPENLVEHSPPAFEAGGNIETGSNTSEIGSDQKHAPASVPEAELTVGAPDPSKSSSTENELLAAPLV
jgi:hypothetical protein